MLGRKLRGTTRLIFEVYSKIAYDHIDVIRSRIAIMLKSPNSDMSKYCLAPNNSSLLALKHILPNLSLSLHILYLRFLSYYDSMKCASRNRKDFTLFMFKN